MARNKRTNFSSTSITDSDAYKFADKAKPREMISCDFLPGFHLLKLSKGVSWRYRYTDISKKRHTITIGSFPAMLSREASEKVYQWVIDENSNPMKDKTERREKAISAEEAKQRKTLGYYLNGRYSLLMESWPPRSVRTTKGGITKHFGNLLDTPMDEITSEHIEAWQDKKAKSGLAYNTIKRNYSALKTIIRQAITDKVIKSTQLDGFKLRDPSFKEQKAIKERADQLAKKRRLLTNGEIASLHNGLDLFAELIRKQRRNSRAHGKPYLADLDNVSLPHWFIPFCHFALHTGLRTGDLYSLTWQELNLNFAKLKKVTGKSTRSIRKGGVGTLVEMKLNQRIHSIMKQWWKQNKKPQTGLVFVSPITGGEFDMGSHNKPWKKVKELAGLPPELNFYSLRHHFISSLVSQGIPMLAVAKLAGHRSTEMIERHYGHLCEVQAAKAIDILGDNIDQAIND